MQSLIYMLLFLLNFFSYKAMAQEWHLESEQQHVQIFSQQTTNGIIKVKAVTRVSSRLGALLNLLDDTRRSSEWIDSNQQVIIIARPTITQAIVHSYFNAPWPISDRDMVTHSSIYQDQNSLQIRIEIEDVGQQYPRVENYVRMRFVKGIWRITPIDNDLLEIEYQGSADPAGNLPHWLANSTLLSSTKRSFEKMRELLVQPQYQRAAPDFIQELPHFDNGG